MTASDDDLNRLHGAKQFRESLTVPYWHALKKWHALVEANEPNGSPAMLAVLAEVFAAVPMAQVGYALQGDVERTMELIEFTKRMDREAMKHVIANLADIAPDASPAN